MTGRGNSSFQAVSCKAPVVQLQRIERACVIKKLVDTMAFLILGLAGLAVMYGLFAFMVVAWVWLDDRALLWHAGVGLVMVSWSAHHVLKVLREPEGDASVESEFVRRPPL